MKALCLESDGANRNAVQSNLARRSMQSARDRGGERVVAIQEITARWFTFLDESRRYFVPRLTHAGVLLTMAVDDLEKTRFFTSAELQGQWVYPSCDD
jgi:hypothetical protein